MENMMMHHACMHPLMALSIVAIDPSQQQNICKILAGHQGKIDSSVQIQQQSLQSMISFLH